ncbi:restriction endonuclease subunit S [Pectobacterium aroidearum]|uniref:restriction endonuclease subunit S n=1 Tax=Pectobacterium aroidearum TaxID=1201031 RepID=UPI0032EF36C9
MKYNQWPRVKISELCELIVDCVNKTAPSVDYETPYKMIRTPNIKGGRVNLTSCRYVEKETFKKWTRRATVDKGDVLLTREAPMGESGYVNFTDTVFLGQRIMQYRADPKKLDSTYLLYAFLSPDLQYQFRRHDSTGSIVSHIRVPDCLEFEISTPELDVQKKIASVLSNIDNKIDINNRINTELETMAKTLYDYWFVQFDFPDSNGKPYKTSGGKMVYNAVLKREIPAGWNSCKLGEFIKMEYGKPLKSENRAGSGYPVFGSSGIVGFHNDYLVEGPGIIIGRKGTVGKVNFTFENFYPIDTTYYVSPKKRISMIFLNYLISSLGLEGMNSDSAVPGLNREAALGLSIVSAPLELISKYHEHAVTWFDKKKIIMEENNNLVKLRDWLLPLLMNGQVTVK